MENGFKGYHPYVLFAYYLMVGILIMVYNHPVFLFTLLMALLLINFSHDSGKSLKKWSVPLLIMGFAFMLINPLLVSRGSHILFYLGNRQITLEATIFGIVMSFMLTSIILLFISFNLILNGNKFLFLFSKILPRTAFLILLTMRFVPLLKRRLDEITVVQRVRGMTLSEGSLSIRARHGMNMIQTLLTWSLEEAIQTADSMNARGYGSGKKSSYVIYKMERKNWFSLATLFALFSINLFCILYGYGKIIIYPKLSTLQFFLLDWIAYLSMIVLALFPLITEGIEYSRWKFYE